MSVMAGNYRRGRGPRKPNASPPQPRLAAQACGATCSVRGPARRLPPVPRPSRLGHRGHAILGRRESLSGGGTPDGEGAVVRGQIPDSKIAVGIPAKVIGDVNEKQKQEWQYYKAKYAELARDRYPTGLKRIA